MTARADEMGSDLVETSAHIGARPEHEVWQGQVFSRSGTSKKYPDFVTSTGYGSAGGLMGVNCRHSYYPFFEGLSKRAYKDEQLDEYASKKVTYQGQKMSVYDATQKQRGIERKIREWKRRRDVLKEAGLDSSVETAKVKDWQARMREFTKDTRLRRQPEREWVFLVKPKPVREISGVRITGERIEHWRKRHPEVTPDIEERMLQKAIEKPDFLQPSKSDPDAMMHYVFDENQKWWVFVIAKSKAGSPFVLTIRRSHRKGK